METKGDYPGAIRIFEEIAEGAGRDLATRGELLNEVWGYESYPTTRTVDNHIATLRSKLEPNPSEPRYLLTVHGMGYKFLV